METSDLLLIVVKTFFIIMLFIYILVSILIARQVFLMNRAIKTKLAGFLNLLSLFHMALVVGLMVLVILV